MSQEMRSAILTGRPRGRSAAGLHQDGRHREFGCSGGDVLTLPAMNPARSASADDRQTSATSADERFRILGGDIASTDKWQVAALLGAGVSATKEGCQKATEGGAARTTAVTVNGRTAAVPQGHA